MYKYIVCIYMFTYTVASKTKGQNFGRSYFENKSIIVIILFLSFANDSSFSMLLWMITTISCQNFSFSQLLFLTNIRF